jgi:hypothetical protein
MKEKRYLKKITGMIPAFFFFSFYNVLPSPLFFSFFNPHIFTFLLSCAYCPPIPSFASHSPSFLDEKFLLPLKTGPGSMQGVFWSTSTPG